MTKPTDMPKPTYPCKRCERPMALTPQQERDWPSILKNPDMGYCKDCWVTLMFNTSLD
jgi:hypothetical protein